MATLNIKGFPDELYDQLREDAEREHRSVTKHATYLLERELQRRRLSLDRPEGSGQEARVEGRPRVDDKPRAEGGPRVKGKAARRVRRGSPGRGDGE